MNLAIFITKANREEMRAVCARLANSQHQLVNGAICVVHQIQLDPKEVAVITAPLTAKFKVKAALPVQANLNHKEEQQLALLFSRFLLAAYAKYPGAWLLMDEPAGARGDNWMQVAEKQHAANGGKMTGKGLVDKGSLLPVGPVTLSLPYQQLKFLKFATNESWRSRGKFFFARCGFQQIPHDQYLFDFNKHKGSPWLPLLGKSDPSLMPDSPSSISFEKPLEVTSPQEGGHFRGVMVSESENIAGPAGDYDQHANPEYVDAPPEEPSKKELIAEVLRLTGHRPHHFTSEAKLKAMIEQSTSTPL
jgi:hypothetical protein